MQNTRELHMPSKMHFLDASKFKKKITRKAYVIKENLEVYRLHVTFLANITIFFTKTPNDKREQQKDNTMNQSNKQKQIETPRREKTNNQHSRN